MVTFSDGNRLGFRIRHCLGESYCSNFLARKLDFLLKFGGEFCLNANSVKDKCFCKKQIKHNSEEPCH